MALRSLLTRYSSKRSQIPSILKQKITKSTPSEAPKLRSVTVSTLTESGLKRTESGSRSGSKALFWGTSAAVGACFLIYASSFDRSTVISSAMAESLASPTSTSSIPAEGSAMGGPVVLKSGRVITKLKIFIGYDPREDIAYEVCRHSLLKHATLPIEVIPIKQSELRRAGIYTRQRDPTESTEFSFTRFLTPYLAGYDGWAMFVDCDFLYTADIRELVEQLDDKYAVMCVQHDYTPKTATKMDGVVQTTYPRKNWSSMVLYNCGHPKNRVLSPAVVNSQSGAFLHRFMWLDDKDIGSIPFIWNFLVGHNEMPKGGHALPKAIHYTSGGPWFEAWQNCDYANEWIQEKEEYKHTHMIQKVIESELVHLLDQRLAERENKLEERIAEMETRLKEVAALQRLLLFYLQDRMLPNAGNVSSNGNGNGKEVPNLKSEDLATLLEERFASATKLYGKD